MKVENYAQSFEELQRIVSEMETGNIGIDELALKVNRAAELISICKAKLKSTELDVQKILSELADTNEED